jgi:hypothetical protein
MLYYTVLYSTTLHFALLYSPFKGVFRKSRKRGKWKSAAEELKGYADGALLAYINDFGEVRLPAENEPYP